MCMNTYLKICTYTYQFRNDSLATITKFQINAMAFARNRSASPVTLSRVFTGLYVYTYMYDVCIRMYKFLCMNIYVYVYMYMYACMKFEPNFSASPVTLSHVFSGLCTYVYIFICIYIYMYVCIFMYVCMHVYTCTCIFMHVYVCIYICTYVHVCK